MYSHASITYSLFEDHVTKKCMFAKHACQFCGKIEVIMGTVGLVVVDGE